MEGKCWPLGTCFLAGLQLMLPWPKGKEREGKVGKILATGPGSWRCTSRWVEEGLAAGWGMQVAGTAGAEAIVVLIQGKKGMAAGLLAGGRCGFESWLLAIHSNQQEDQCGAHG